MNEKYRYVTIWTKAGYKHSGWTRFPCNEIGQYNGDIVLTKGIFYEEKHQIYKDISIDLKQIEAWQYEHGLEVSEDDLIYYL